MITTIAGPAVTSTPVAGTDPGLAATAVMSDPSASDLLRIPSGGLNAGEGKGEFFFNRQFETSEFDRVAAAFAYRYRSLTFSSGYFQMGENDLYVERTYRVGIALSLDSLTAGAYLQTIEFDFGPTIADLSVFMPAFGVSYRTNKFIAAFTAENVTAPRPHPRSAEVEPVYILYAELIGYGSYSLTGRATFERHQDVSYGIGQKISVASHSALYWGLSTAPLLLGGGFEIEYGGATLKYSAAYHSVLGVSYTASIGFGFGNNNHPPGVR